MNDDAWVATLFIFRDEIGFERQYREDIDTHILLHLADGNKAVKLRPRPDSE